MIELLAASIIIHGNADGVWSPSHPHQYPAPVTIVLPSIPQVEERYIPETPMTDGNGNLIFPHKAP